ncbi:hypothetical protein GCM10010468_07680 [Actinocorallia longicatena]|uniref:Signal peptidase I n=1 Tax=Actinocorallia longicatena TaxID=111803 RepID=A0ABP6Q1P8_9ACTN
MRSDTEGSAPEEVLPTPVTSSPSDPRPETGDAPAAEAVDLTKERGDEQPGVHDAPDAPDVPATAAGDAGSGEGGDGSPEEPPRRQPSFWKELPLLIGVALVLALVIKAFIVQAFYIPSGSMENTLQVGDRVLVNKVVYRIRDITRGDIVVFNGLDSWDPEVEYEEPGNPISRLLHNVGTAFGVVPGEKDYIKRVIGVPGDRVVCCEPGTGRITVNGHPLDETSYLFTDPDTGEQNVPSDKKFDITVPTDRLWVMGDHRDVSYDSRGHSADKGNGTIPITSVVGRAFVVVWPIPHWQVLDIPATFAQQGLAAALPHAPLPLAFALAFPLTRLTRRLRHR